MSNPLLTNFKYPPFSAILPEHMVPAVKTFLDNCRIKVNKILATGAPYTWETLCQPLEELSSDLNRIVSPIRHLNAVKNSVALRQSYESCLLLLSEYNTWIGQHEELYNAWRHLKESPQYLYLDSAKKQTINNTLRDFRLSGIELNKIKKKRYAEIISRLSQLSFQYSNNVMDATNGWHKLIINNNDLKGIPELTLATAYNQAKNHGLQGWLINLNTPTYLAIITWCENPALREEIYYAYNTRASDQGPNAGKWDNSLIIEEELILRHELAQILGFASYADQSIITKMAESPIKVKNFLENLLERIYPQAEKEMAQLKKFAKEMYNVKQLNAWDIAFYSEKQKQHLYGINEEHFRTYFPVEKVLNSMFEIVNRIYGITIKERNNVEVWHPNVRFFDLFNENNELCGSFYLDLYTRETKISGAWMDICLDFIRRKNNQLQKPIVYLTTNFSPPLNNDPALLTHSEVITLFHEFGHVIHHLVSRIETLGVSGIYGIPYDAVEFPSQFMENWCWEPKALLLISAHYKTGNSLPPKLLEKLLAAKNYQAGLFLLRQLELSLFDLRLHADFNPQKGAKFLYILQEIHQSISVVPYPEWNRFSHSFLHIFSHGYEAGYYSYLWANVLAADAYSRFQEEGIFNSTIGKSFLKKILEKGGSEEPMILFKKFMGREPQIEAMLNNYGIN
ncbi:MAG: oligopeptidase A [Candidatus Dasytiphilus stammeri]